jgi:very-short-patch-repair endonuclease
MLEIFCTGMEGPLCSTPSQPVARVLPDLPGTKANIETVRYLRTNTTPAERHLWKLIRGKNVGVKFRRQHPLGQFVLDFYAPQIRLAIELDGSIHNEALQKEYDRFRQKLIEQYEICFLRFGNELVLNMPSVPRDIIATIALRNKKYYYGICWTPAENIEVGDAVFAFGRNERRTVCAKRCFAADEKVYNLRVAEDNSYVTETCTVHNCVSER